MATAIPITGSYQDRLESLRLAHQARQQDQNSDDIDEPLCIDTHIELTIQLSWGGPSDGYRLTCTTDGEVVCGNYFLAHWGECEEVPLSRADIDRVVDLYLGGDPRASFRVQP
jgi:hypothetical protein